MAEYENKIKEMANRYIERHAGAHDAKKDVEAAQRRLEVAQSQLLMVRDELAATVGRNVPVRNIVVGRQLIRVEFEAADPVRVEPIL